jgi:hypothetical protein
MIAYRLAHAEEMTLVLGQKLPSTFKDFSTHFEEDEPEDAWTTVTGMLAVVIACCLILRSVQTSL